MKINENNRTEFAMSSKIWMKPDVALDPPYLCVYRTIFMLERETTLEFDYSASNVLSGSSDLKQPGNHAVFIDVDFFSGRYLR